MPTRMHLHTHVRAEHRDQLGLTARTEYADGMIEHDGYVDKLLKTTDDLGIANDTKQRIISGGQCWTLKTGRICRSGIIANGRLAL
jgi:hypothetical protein